MKDYFYDVFHFSKGVRWFIASETMLGIGIGLFNLLLNLHLLAGGLSEREIGSVTSAGTLVVGLASIPCSLLGTRFGRKRMLVAGLLLMAAGYIGFGIGSGLPFFYAAQIVQSIGLTLLITSEVQLLFSYSSSKKEETQGFSLLFAVFTLFSGVGTLIGGILPKVLRAGGVDGGGIGIHMGTPYSLSLVAAGCFVLGAAIARGILLPKESERPPAASSVDRVKQEERRSGGKGRKLRKLPISRTAFLLAWVHFGIGVSFGFVEPFLSLLIKLRLSWPDSWTSLLLTLNGLFMFAASFSMPLLLERWGMKKIYRAVFVLSGGISLLLASQMPVGMFALLFLLRGGGYTLLGNLISSHTMSALPDEERNLFAGMRSVFRSVGGAAAAFATGWVLEAKQEALPFLLSGIALVGCWIFAEKALLPYLQKKLEGETDMDSPA